MPLNQTITRLLNSWLRPRASGKSSDLKGKSYTVEPLNKRHDRAGFSSGKPALDDFIKKSARQFDGRDLSRPWVLVPNGKSTIIGYYTMSGSVIKVDLVPPALRNKYPRLDWPVVHIGQLAVDSRYQRQKFGEYLLLHAFRQAQEQSKTIGFCGVDLIVAEDHLVAFYEKYGMVRLLADHSGRPHMFIKMSEIRAAKL